MLRRIFLITLILFIFSCSSSFALVKFWNGDNLESQGLDSVKDSLGYKVSEIERHFHAIEYWYGSTAGTSPAVSTSITVFDLTTGAENTYGDFVKISEGTEMLADHPGCAYFDFHRFMLIADTADNMYTTQLWQGTTTENATLLTEFPFNIADANKGNSGPIDIKAPRIMSSSVDWARAKGLGASKAISFIYGIHCYEN